MWSEGSITPHDWESLDGTFYVSPEGKPYMVFCHEWTQIHNGTVCAVELSADLKHAVGTPQVLFAAHDVDWVVSIVEKDNYVTDGPFVFRHGDSLRMLWSSFSSSGYTMALAESSSGSILGPWKHLPDLVFTKDGGHGMYFKDFEGQGYIVLHQPNHYPDETPVLFSASLDK